MSHMVGHKDAIQPDLFNELAPVVKRAAAKMLRKYALRLSRRRVICPEDLENVGWARVLEQLAKIEQIPTGDERNRYVYVLVCGAIHNEFSYVATGGDDAIRLTPNGTLDTGTQDNSYDGGTTVFSSGDDVTPAGVQPADECWTAPTVWDAWKNLDLTRRLKLLEMAGLRGSTVLEPDGTRTSSANAKWNALPYDYQIQIESAWKQTARGELRKNKCANGVKPHNAFGFAATVLPHPAELAAITPPRLRAVSLLVYGGGFYTTGNSINSAEISKILGKSARTVLRDHTELMKLWGGYVRSDAVAKRDEKKFPRYPLHTNIAEEFSNMPVDAQMPAPSNPVLESMMMTADRARDLYQRMGKYHTDFSDATVTATIVTPRAVIYECGPQPSAFKIIADFQTRVPESDGHSQTIDYFYRKPSPNDSRGWIPIVCRDGVKQPIVWLHDWSASAAADIFGDKPDVRKDDGRAQGAPIYPGSGLGWDSASRAVNTITNGWGGCGGGSSVVTPQYFPVVMPLLGATERRAMFYRQAHKKPVFTRVGNWTQTRQLSELYLTTQRSASVALYPGEFAREEKKTYCECPLCKYMRKEALQYFADARDDADGFSLPINFSPLTTGLLHGQSRPVGVYRYKETHYLGKHGGHDVWGIAEEGLPYCYFERVPSLDVNPPRFIAAPYPHDLSDTIEVTETTMPYHLSGEEIASIADKEERELRTRLRERRYAGHVHRVLNRHVLDCGESQSVAEIAAAYRSEERKEAAKTSADENAFLREQAAASFKDEALLRQVEIRIRAAFAATICLDIA